MLDLRMDMWKRAVMGGGGGAPVGNSPASQQFFDRLLTPPSGARETLYASLIDGLVADGIWPKLDVLTLIGADQATYLTNMVSALYPTTLYTLITGTLTYTADTGWTGASGAGAWLEVGYNLEAVPGHYKRDDAMLGVWSVASEANPFDHALGVVSAAHVLGFGCQILPICGSSPTNTSWAINTANPLGDELIARPVPVAGSWTAVRTGGAASAVYKNGVLLDTSTDASVVMTGLIPACIPIRLLRGFWLGSSLTAPQVASLHSRLNTYITAVAGVSP